jgi:hypothetical protein
MAAMMAKKNPGQLFSQPGDDADIRKEELHNEHRADFYIGF